MLTSVRSLLAATILAGSVFVAAPAAAQVVNPADEVDDGGFGIDISANAAIVSEYRFRGVDLSGGDIAIQGGIDIGLPAGFYVGTWGSSIDEDTVGYGHTELDVYGGWSTDISETVSLDVGVLWYLYPNAGPGDFDYVEFYGSVGFAVGPAELALGVAYAPDQDSLDFDAPLEDESDDNLYLYGDVGVGIPGTPVSLSGHLGYTEGVLSFKSDALGGYGTAWDWSIGADVALGDILSIGAAYVGAEGDAPGPGDYDFTDDAFVITLSASY